MSRALAQGARGGGLTVAGQFAKMLVQFVSLVTLSRLLAPEDFGLIAMVTAFIALGELIRDFGTTVVGLQRPNLTQQQASNLFWLSISLGAGASLVLLLLTPLIVLLYSEPRLSAVVPTLAGTVLLNAASAQLQVQLARNMKFARLVTADLASQLLGLATAVLGAFLGWGYWALVAQVLCSSTLGLLLRWTAARWMPSWPSRDVGNRRMVGDTVGFGLAQLLNYVSTNLDTVTIGSRWDATSLSGYTRAFQLLTAPLNSIIGPLTQVVIPMVNRARSEGRTADSVLLRLQFTLGLPIVWIYAMTAAIADWLIPFLLGPEWTASVKIFQILAVGGVVWTFSRVSYWGFIAGNLSKELVRYNLVTKTISSLLILGASFISIDAVAWSVSLGLVISWPINLFWLAKSAGQDSIHYLTNGLQLIIAAGLGFSVAWGAFSLLSFIPPYVASVLAVLIGTIVYLGAIASSTSGRRSLAGVSDVLRSMLRRGATG